MSEFLKSMKEKFFETEDEETVEDEFEEESASQYEQANNENVRNVNAKMIVKEPRSFEDATEIGSYLLRKKAVVVNIHRLTEGNATRLLDFLSGVTFAIKGSKQKVDKNVFLFAPNEMPVDGSIDEQD